MRIGFDLFSYDPINSDGVATFSIGLLEGFLANTSPDLKFVLLVSHANSSYFLERFRNRNVQIYCVPVSKIWRYLNRFLWIFSWLCREYRLRFWYEFFFRSRLSRAIESQVDALVVPTTVFNFYSLKIPTILCIHDIQQEFYPENFSLKQKILRWASYRLSCDRATIIQVSSRYIYNCLLEKFVFLHPHKLFIAPEGVDANKFSLSVNNIFPKSLANIPLDKFIFYPAQIWKHKNHILLMKALSLFRERKGFEFSCVLTGHDYGYWTEVDRVRLDLELKSIYYLGRVEFSELIWIYKNCSAVLALGLHESSSLPVREGATFGKPLICADIAPNIEASEYLHLNLFKQDSPEALADTLIELHHNQNIIGQTAEQNLGLISKLRWEIIAKMYIDRLSLSF